MIALKIEKLSGEAIIGLALLIVALGATYYLIKRAGLLACKLENENDDIIKPREELSKRDDDA